MAMDLTCKNRKITGNLQSPCTSFTVLVRVKAKPVIRIVRRSAHPCSKPHMSIELNSVDTSCRHVVIIDISKHVDK